MRAHNKSNGRKILGAGLVIIGLVLFAQNIFNEFFVIDIFSWPIILFTIGIIILLNHKDSFWGIVLVSIGGIGITSKIFHLPFRFIIYEFWPIILIVLGIYLIVQSFIKSTNDDDIIEGENLYIDLFKIFGNANKLVKSQSFKGGKLTTIMGEINLDLTNTKSAASTIVIDNLTLFGSSTIRIPQNWDLVIKATTIFGGLEDKRSPVDLSEEKTNVLVIKGIILFGGGTINN